MPNKKTKIRNSFSATICFVVILSAFSYAKINSLIRSAQFVNKSTQLTTKPEKLMGSIIDVETWQHGYPPTHYNKLIVIFFHSALQEYPKNIEAVQQLITNNPEQQENFTAVKRLL
jgi:CHASE3 domain sensor protein